MNFGRWSVFFKSKICLHASQRAVKDVDTIMSAPWGKKTKCCEGFEGTTRQLSGRVPELPPKPRESRVTCPA